MRKIIFIAVFAIIACTLEMYSQNKLDKYISEHELTNLFKSDSLIQVSLYANLQKVYKDNGDEQEYHSAKLIVHKKNTTEEFDIKIQTRGNFRKKRSTCRIPPLRINFKKKQVKNTIFDGQNKIKLVTHCQKRESYQQNMLIEYLIYKMYNEISEASFHVRLAEIEYIDSSGKFDPVTKYAFFLEDNDDVASRMGKRRMDINQYDVKRIDGLNLSNISLFQFMIGNTDWSITKLHNIEIMTGMNDKYATAYPYDFDWSGIISAPYAQPAPQLNISSVRERLFRGYCFTNNYISHSIKLFNDKREVFLKIIDEFEYLDDKYKKSCINYLNEFYNIINNPRLVEMQIVNNCREN